MESDPKRIQSLARQVLYLLALAPGARARPRLLPPHGVRPELHLLMPDGGLFVQLVWDNEYGRPLLKRVRQLLSLFSGLEISLLLVGAPQEVEPLLTEAWRATRRKKAARIIRLEPSGRSELVVGSPLHGDLLQVLERVGEAPGQVPLDEQKWTRLLDEARETAIRENQEMAAFRKAIQARRPRATWFLAALMVVVFLLELAWGATDSLPVLVRMGALYDRAVMEGEAWRLLSAAFLHGNTTHILFNGLVLVQLGGFLERLLGSGRFMVLFTLTAISGSAASLGFSHSVSVGASGALWGFMGAAAWFAFRPPPGFLPAALVSSLRRATGQALVVNLLISLLPMVDLAAHLGGGLAGALFAATGWLHRGRETGARRPRAPRSGEDSLWRLAANTSLLVVVACVVAGLGAGRAWDRSGEWTWEPVELPTTDLSVELPAAMVRGEPETSDDGFVDVIYGDPVRDGLMVEVTVSPLSDEETPHLDLTREFEALKRQLGEEPTPEGVERVRTRIPPDGSRFWIEEQFALEGDARYHRLHVLHPPWMLVFQAVARHDAPEPAREALDRVLQEARELASAPPPASEEPDAESPAEGAGN